MRSQVIAMGFAASLSAGASLDAQPAAGTDQSPCVAAASSARGTVRRLDGGAVGRGVPVTVAWNVLTLKGLSVRTERCERTAETTDEGAFEVSGVPLDETVLLSAIGGSGEAGVSLRHDTADPVRSPLTIYLPAADEVAEAIRGGGTCQTLGRVVNTTGAPVRDARVRVDGQAAVLTDWQGAFRTRTCAPDGAAFDVRGLTVAPAEWWMPLTSQAPVVAISLDRPRPRLDAVVVRATQGEYRDVTGFNRRCRGGTGRCLTLENLSQSQPASMREFINASKGALVTWNGRVSLGRYPGCPARLMVNGVYDPGMEQNGLNMDDIVGVELHGSLPLEFGGFTVLDLLLSQNSWYWTGDFSDLPFRRPGRLAGGWCGAVVVWTTWGLGREIGS